MSEDKKNKKQHEDDGFGLNESVPSADRNAGVKKLPLLLELFWVNLRISALTLGGGYAIVAVMKREFVDKRGWLEESQMLDYAAISQSSIGPIAINTSFLVGHKMAGQKGAAVAVTASVLPPLIVMTVLAYAYDFFISSGLIRSALLGMQAATAAVIADTAISLAAVIWREGRLFAAVIAGITFLLAAFTPINSAAVIIGGGAAGIIRAAAKARAAK